MTCRVTIFSLDDCNHCKRTIAALKARDVPYLEINLSLYPSKRLDMLELSDRLTVPQVFFDGEHIGGADDTVGLLEDWDKQPQPNPLERFKARPNFMGPVDPRLNIPSERPVPPSSPPPRLPQDSSLLLPNGEEATILDVTKTLMKTMPRANIPWLARVYKDCFKGRDGVATLMRHYELRDREEAIQLGRRLQQMQMLHHVTEDHAFGNTDYYFRLQPFHQPNVLNSFRVWTERVDPDSMGLLDRLRKAMGKVVSAATDEDGLVDYVAAEADPNYIVFEEAVCELQGVMMAVMDENTRKAFSINVYNLMIQHAFIKVGIPSSTGARGSFYGNVCYNIGGDVLSFDQVEHGIIRANTRPPYQLSSPFSKDDPRYKLALERLDPRIHFALNCGAKSCPPIKNFTAHCVDEELRIVAQAFCEEDENVSMDEGKNELSLSMIFNWYRADFAESTSKLPGVVVDFLRNERKEKLQRMIASGKPVSVKFKRYDWNPIASRTKSFGSSKIAPNEMTIKAFFSGHTICGADASLVDPSLTSVSSN